MLFYDERSRVCENQWAIIRKYNLNICRQCFREYAKDIGFVKVRVESSRADLTPSGSCSGAFPPIRRRFEPSTPAGRPRPASPTLGVLRAVRAARVPSNAFSRKLCHGASPRDAN